MCGIDIMGVIHCFNCLRSPTNLCMLAKIACGFLNIFVKKASDTSPVLPLAAPSCTHKDMGPMVFNVLDARCLLEENING